MVFKRYIKRDGKKFGPYLYESYRDSNGNVQKRYVGRGSSDNSIVLPVVLAIFLILSIIVILSYQGIVGKIILNVKESYLEINLKNGELLPMNSKLLVNQNGVVKEFLLSDLVSSNANGNFYVEKENIIGGGAGYGFMGEKRIYPKVYFTIILRAKSETSSESGVISENQSFQGSETTTETAPAETETTETIPAEETITEETTAETPSETITEPINPETTTETSIATETPVAGSGAITGESVSESEEVWHGSVSADESFELNLKNQIAVLEGQVYSDYENLSIGILSLKTTDDKATVSTDYYISEKGFGEQYLENENNYINLDLDKLGIGTDQSESIVIQLVYQDKVLAETSAEVKGGKAVRKPLFELGNETLANETILNETNITSNEFKIIKNIEDISLIKNSNYTLYLDNYFLNAESYSADETSNLDIEIDGSKMIISPNLDFTGNESVEANAYSGNDSLSQEFSVIVSDSKFLISTKQYKAVINHPVKWVKTVRIEKLNQGSATPILLELPKEAENITVKAGSEAVDAVSLADSSNKIVEETDRKDIAEGKITGLVSMEIKKKPGLITRFWFWLRSSFTGNVISDSETGIVYNESDAQNFLSESENIKVVDISAVANETQQQEIAVEYTTPAPIANETEISGGKRVVISAGDNLNYTDVLAYTELDNRVSINETGKIRLYWYNNETGEVVRQSVDFDAYDLDSDGKADYIEWVVPHLSKQIYEIIYITKADWLDENRNFVEDVYEQVKSLDGNYVVIPSGNYLRVTFEQNLTNKNDITIYARAGCNSTIKINDIDVPCGVYYKKLKLDALRRENG